MPTQLGRLARGLVSGGRGILAAAEYRRDCLQLLVTTPRLHRGISGVILSGETFGQRLDSGIPFPHAVTELGMLPGIRADIGMTALAGAPGENVTEGLDHLRERLAGVAFRCGAQRPAAATRALAAMQRLGAPWPLTFCFGPALVDPALAAWRGDPARVRNGQQALTGQVNCATAAACGPATPVAGGLSADSLDDLD